MDNRIEILPDVFLTSVQTDKFKTACFSVNFLRPHSAHDAALDALLSGEVDAAVFTTFDKAFADILVQAIIDRQICQCD